MQAPRRDGDEGAHEGAEGAPESEQTLLDPASNRWLASKAAVGSTLSKAGAGGGGAIESSICASMLKCHVHCKTVALAVFSTQLMVMLNHALFEYCQACPIFVLQGPYMPPCMLLRRPCLCACRWP